MDPTLDLRVESLAYGGDAVAHAADGRAVFLTGGCPGDVVTASMTEDHGRFLRATIIQIVEASPERRQPPCPYFGACGGCQWQHVAHTAQVDAKRQAVTDALHRIGGLHSPPVSDVIVGGAAYGYRNKVELRCSTGHDGRLVVGMSARGTDDLVEIDSCLLLPDRCRAAPRALSGALRFLSRGGNLGVERIALRAAHHKRDLEVSLWGPPGSFPRQMAATTLSRAIKSTSLVRVLVSDQKRGRSSAKLETLGGAGTWSERLGKNTYRVSAPAFFQVNTVVAEALVAEVVRAAGTDGADRVLDAFAGVGTFTLPLAAVAGEVVSVEMTSAALRDLTHNLDAAGLDAQAIGGDVVRELPGLGRFDVVVIDPPRNGIPPDALAAVIAGSPRRIVYVSCDPTTLARDAKTLASAGYALVAAVPVDLFPQTYHVETVASFDRGTG